MMGPTKSSCLSAVVIAVTMQFQADAFVSTGVVSGRNAVSMSSLTQGSSSPIQTPSRWATSSFKLSSTYEEYMASREKQSSMPPAEKEKSLFEEYSQARVSRPGESRPAPSPPSSGRSSPSPAPSPAPAKAEELSPYEEYRRSRDNIKKAEAGLSPEVKEKSNVYGDYMASREQEEGEAPADCAEEECDADEVVEQAGLFASYMASRGIKTESSASPSSAAPKAATKDEPAKELSPYEEYLKSRQEVNVTGASVKPEEIKKVSEFESFANTRAEREAEEAKMSADEKKAALREDFEETSGQKSGEKHRGVGGMADTRDPAPVNHADPRKSISAAPSFAEYLKSKKN